MSFQYELQWYDGVETGKHVRPEGPSLFDIGKKWTDRECKREVLSESGP